MCTFKLICYIVYIAYVCLIFYVYLSVSLFLSHKSIISLCPLMLQLYFFFFFKPAPYKTLLLKHRLGEEIWSFLLAFCLLVAPMSEIPATLFLAATLSSLSSSQTQFADCPTAFRISLLTTSQSLPTEMAGAPQKSRFSPRGLLSCWLVPSPQKFGFQLPKTSPPSL